MKKIIDSYRRKLAAEEGWTLKRGASLPTGFRCPRRIVVTLAVLFTCTSVNLAQDAGLPPLGVDAIQHVGQIVSKYDKFTDKSKIELALQVNGEYLNGTFLVAVCIFNGQIVPANAKVALGVLAVGNEFKFVSNNKIILLVDTQRQVYEPQRFPLTIGNGKVLELLLIPHDFSADELLGLARAKKLEGRAGSYDEFEVSAAQRERLQEFARQMTLGRDAAGSSVSSARVIELPSNFSYKRELGDQTGLPVYVVTPNAEAMEADAKKGNVFQALGVMTQPEANKGGLMFFNAQTQFQLQIAQAKGAYITIGSEVLHIPEYEVLDKRDVGKLKLETALIRISNDVLLETS